MKRLLLLLSTVSAISAADVEGLNSKMNALNVGYSSDVEYATHQEVHERFFKRTTKNTTARTAIDKFKQELKEKKSKHSRIYLDGLSSRTRIIMMRELIRAALRIKKIDVSKTNGKVTVARIPLSFQGTRFKLNLTPTPDQPGSGVLTCIGSYSGDIFPVLTSYNEAYQSKYAKKTCESSKNSEWA